MGTLTTSYVAARAPPKRLTTSESRICDADMAHGVMVGFSRNQVLSQASIRDSPPAVETALTSLRNQSSSSAG